MSAKPQTAKGEAFAESLARIGIESTFKSSGEARAHVDLHLPLGSALKLMNDWKAFDWREPDNIDRYLVDAHDSHSEFAGKSITEGSTKRLREHLERGPDMKPYQAALDEFLKSGIGREIATRLLEVTPKRKRRFSEHDGEWDYDRRYEISPFSATTKALSPARVLTIIADFSISACADAKEIDRYGAIVWGVSQLIEKAGIQTEIIWRCTTTGCDTKHSIDANISVVVKRPGQYLAPHMIAACFKSVFFRRVGFSLIAACAHVGGEQESYGLGSPKQLPFAAQFTEGKLHLAPSVSKGYTEQLKQSVLDAIRGIKAA